MWDDGKSSALIFPLKAVRHSISRDGKTFDEGDTSISAHSVMTTKDKLFHRWYEQPPDQQYQNCPVLTEGVV